MKREIIITKDGSTTIFFPEINETYHSKFGAIQESYHVFVDAGLHQKKNDTIFILEVGYGTGLNAFITFLDAEKSKQNIDYIGVEAFPISNDEIQQLNFVDILNAHKYKSIFEAMHNSVWNEKIAITENFILTKRKQFFQEIDDKNAFDIIYFDAFGFRIEPELWSKTIFEKMFIALKIGGILVTYACRSSIKNDMIELGFKVEKLPGAPGKREMLRATKL